MDYTFLVSNTYSRMAKDRDAYSAGEEFLSKESDSQSSHAALPTQRPRRTPIRGLEIAV